MPLTFWENKASWCPPCLGPLTESPTASQRGKASFIRLQRQLRSCLYSRLQIKPGFFQHGAGRTPEAPAPVQDQSLPGRPEDPLRPEQARLQSQGDAAPEPGGAARVRVRSGPTQPLAPTGQHPPRGFSWCVRPSALWVVLGSLVSAFVLSSNIAGETGTPADSLAPVPGGAAGPPHAASKPPL